MDGGIRRRRSLTLVAFVWMGMVVLNWPRLATGESAPLPFVFTGNLNGKLDPRPSCCSSRKAFSFSQWKPWYTDFRKTHPQSILVDTGNLFFSSRLPTPDEAPILIADAIKQIEFDVISPGPLDLLRGREDFVTLSVHHGRPLVATNLKQSGGQPTPWRPFVMVTRGEIRIAFLSVIHPLWRLPAPLELVDPEVAIGTTLDSWKASRPDLIALISHLDEEETQSILKKFPQINLVFHGVAPSHSSSFHRKHPTEPIYQGTAAGWQPQWVPWPRPEKNSRLEANPSKVGPYGAPAQNSVH